MLHVDMTIRSRRLLAVVTALVATSVALAACTSTSTPATSTTAPRNSSTTTTPGTTGTTGTTTTIPGVTTTATPKGWVPVAFGDAQISVPRSWAVAYVSSDPCAWTFAPGTVFVGDQPRVFCPNEPAPSSPAAIVRLQPLQQVPAGSSSAKPMTVNGIKVVGGPAELGRLTYFVPSLGVELQVSPGMAHRILATLSRSPRAVALATGAAPPVPNSWKRISFADVTFAVPGRWPVWHTDRALGIGPPCTDDSGSLGQHGVALSADRYDAVSGCPAFGPGFRTLVTLPVPGVQVDVGPKGPQLAPKTLGRWTEHHGLSIALASEPAYSVLALRASVISADGVADRPIVILIGLTGTGVVARTILGSLQAFAPTSSAG